MARRTRPSTAKALPSVPTSRTRTSGYRTSTVAPLGPRPCRLPGPLNATLTLGPCGALALDVGADPVGGVVEVIARRTPWIMRGMARLAPATGRR